MKLHYCCAKCLTWVTFNVSFFVIGIVLWLGGTSQYGIAINYETKQWNSGAIVDVITQSSNVCQQGYELIQGVFEGTRDACVKNGYYETHACGRREGGYTQYGMGERTLNKLNNLYICVKRDANLNYHNLINKRSAKCSVGVSCGSKTDSEKSFCLTSGTTCPLNTFDIVPKTSNTTYSGTMKSFSSSSNGYFNRYNNSYNPISQVIISLSRPCGIGSQEYQVRPIAAEPIYKDEADTCYYGENGNKEHYQYLRAGFNETEFDIYTNNGLINEIKNNVPYYKADVLSRNSYYLWYRPFALYKSECQMDYTSQEITDLGQEIGDASKLFFVLFIITVVLYGIQCFQWVTYCLLNKCPDLIKAICFIKFGVLETLGYFALIIIYSITINAITKIDLTIVKYFNENNCSEGVLAYSFETYVSQFEHDKAVTGLGLGFTLLTFLIKLGTCICYSPLKDVLVEKCKICKCLERRTLFERKFEAASESIRQRYNSYIMSRLQKKFRSQIGLAPIPDEQTANPQANVFAPSNELQPLSNQVHDLESTIKSGNQTITPLDLHEKQKDQGPQEEESFKLPDIQVKPQGRLIQ